MAHSPGFDRLRRLFAVAFWADEQGIEPDQAEAAYEQMLLDRRSVLRGMAAAAAMVVLPGSMQACASKPPARDNVEQLAVKNPRATSVAIIGGGIAGLHCAHRLKSAGLQPTVYEAQNRTGGRMWTSRDKFDGLLFEIGGELIDSTHKTMIALAAVRSHSASKGPKGRSRSWRIASSSPSRSPCFTRSTSASWRCPRKSARSSPSLATAPTPR